MEAVEIVSGLVKERDEFYLAMCPLCSAKYKEFVKRSKIQSKEVIQELLQTDSSSIMVELGEDTGELQFVETHIHDIAAILKELEV